MTNIVKLDDRRRNDPITNEDREAEGLMRTDYTRFEDILAKLDTADGRNDALVAYIYALRDLQCANDTTSYADQADTTLECQQAVDAAFTRLVTCQIHLSGGLRAHTELAAMVSKAAAEAAAEQAKRSIEFKQWAKDQMKKESE